MTDEEHRAAVEVLGQKILDLLSADEVAIEDHRVAIEACVLAAISVIANIDCPSCRQLAAKWVRQNTGKMATAADKHAAANPTSGQPHHLH